MSQNLDNFIDRQLSAWPEVKARFDGLSEVSTRHIKVGGLDVTLQHNPARIASATAKTDAASLKKRACFLCVENEPAEQQRFALTTSSGGEYYVQINPFPIFPKHIVIPSREHTPQSIRGRFEDMLDLADEYQSHTFFYNGPQCGASAPDHHHFQACPRGLMPLECAVEAALEGQSDVRLDHILNEDGAVLLRCGCFTRGIYVLSAPTSEAMSRLFYHILECAPLKPEDDEPRFNLFAYRTTDAFRVIVILRDKHLSHHYFSDGPDQLTMSLGCADMTGFVIVSVPDDYAKLTPELLGEMLDEVSISEEDEALFLARLTRRQRTIDVGIMSGSSITFEIIPDGDGPRTVSIKDGCVEYAGQLFDELSFNAPASAGLFADPYFTLHGVTIGVGFHWERQLTQTFAGSLKFIVDGDKLVAVNTIGVEDYLLSVISSEMKATASLDFLKAHAVISRSWVISQIERGRGASDRVDTAQTQKDDEFIKWWDHEDHTLFDVCADDHCQRYQGWSMAVGANVRKAISETWGQVLTSEGSICDARFSKCCGGVMEVFSKCWEDRDYPYLQALPDTPGEEPGGQCFCDTADQEILSQVLNDYDLETMDFYRWDVRYSRPALSELINRRTGLGFGEVRELIPVERGESGRISRLRVVGSERTLTIGKELMIRRALSESHLKSSAFVVEMDGDDFILHGRGWGHGVGLCQIGAAVMSCKGYDYRQILGHYYPGALITRI